METSERSSLKRDLGLVGLAATGICAMLGAAINVIPIMIHRSVPDIGPWVLPAYLFGALPAVIAAMAYAILASAMPRAGGSYVYASRSIGPYFGFVASFSQWFGLSIAMGVVSYVLIPFLRDIAAAVELSSVASALDSGPVRVGLALAFLWASVLVNVSGVASVQRTLVPLMYVMFALGGIVIIAGFSFDQTEFAAAVLERHGHVVPLVEAPPFRMGAFLAASAVLFSSFIGFDSIAQAGGEARNPGRNLPLAVAISIISVGAFYFLFTAAVYHAVPWQYVAEHAQTTDLTAPGLLGNLLSPGWTVAIVLGAAIALANDLPAMLLSVSRLMFAWAEDGIFPKVVARVHPTRHTPGLAIVLSGLMASAAVIGSHLAGDFFLGVDILVTAMLVNFLVMCVAVLTLPAKNERLAREITVFRSRTAQIVLASIGILVLGTFLGIHIWKDLVAPVEAWYFRSTPAWLLVMAAGSAIYVREMRRLRASGRDVRAIFRDLPDA